MLKKANFKIFKASIVICLLLGIVVANAQASNLNKKVNEMNKPTLKPWTTLYYIDHDYGSGIYDPLEEIFIDEIATTNNVNVVVIQDLLNDPAFIYFIDEDHNKITLEELGEVNMADYQTLRDFIDYGKQNYPAERYLLLVYDHGGAWKGACIDETNNDFTLSMDEFQIALTEAGGVDIICFFACLMSSLESVYELRDLVDIYIGSEDLAWGSWWDGICGDVNQLLTDNPGLSSADVGIEFVNFFEKHSNPPSEKLTMSAIRTDKVKPLVSSLDALVKYFVFHWLRSYGKVKAAHDNTFLLADWESWAEVFEVYDLKDFIENLPESPLKKAVLDAFDEAVIAEVHGGDMEETNGLSIFLQPRKSQYGLFKEYKDPELGLDLPRDTWWNEFLFLLILTNTLLRR